MKKILTSAVMLLSFTVLFANEVDPKLWNNNGKEKTFHKGDSIKVKAGTKSSKYVSLGTVETVCNANYIKVDGYFVAIADVEVITKYYTAK